MNKIIITPDMGGALIWNENLARKPMMFDRTFVKKLAAGYIGIPQKHISDIIATKMNNGDKTATNMNDNGLIPLQKYNSNGMTARYIKNA